MKKIYLHVGLPKTGTTSLQTEVFPNIPGVDYKVENQHPMFKIIYAGSLHYDPKHVLNNISLEEGKNLLSLENLSSLIAPYELTDPGHVSDKLAELFPDANILIVLRNQFDMLRSLYAHSVKLGCTIPFRKFVLYADGKLQEERTPEFFGYTYITYLRPRKLDYLALVKRYEKNFKNVTVLSYGVFKNDPEKFLNKVSEWLETDEPLPTPSHRNTGTGARQIAISRFCNRFVRSRHNDAPLLKWKDSKSIYHILQSRLSKKILGNKQLEDAEVERAVIQYYSKANSELNDRFQLGLAT